MRVDLSQCQIGRAKPNKGKKQMNAQIKELTEQLPISADVQKSIANRLESALTKKGSAQSRLRMASQSLNALANKYEADTDENGYADIFARIFEIGAQIGVDNKTEATPKTTREQWHDADSAEGQAIIASVKPKPRKKATKTEPKYYKDEQLTEMLREAFANMLAGR
jgi:hypothetical protein